MARRDAAKRSGKLLGDAAAVLAAMWLEIRDTIRLLPDQGKPPSDGTMH